MNLKEFAIAVGVSAVAIAAAALLCNDWLGLSLTEYLRPPVDLKLF